MSGYREHGFDPNAGENEFPQPPTWLQRIGIACLFVGAAMIFAYLGGQWGLVPKWIDSPVPATMVVVAAGPLIGAGARRGPLSPDTRRKRLIVVAVAFAVCALAAATIFVIKGA